MFFEEDKREGVSGHQFVGRTASSHRKDQVNTCLLNGASSHLPIEPPPSGEETGRNFFKESDQPTRRLKDTGIWGHPIIIPTHPTFGCTTGSSTELSM
jgi:hypothetical protein